MVSNYVDHNLKICTIQILITNIFLQIIVFFLSVLHVFQFKYNNLLQLYKQLFTDVIHGISNNTFAAIYSHWHCSILQ